MKGHAKQIDIDRGRTTLEDKQGNDGADALAVAGAESHKIDLQMTEAASLRKLVAKQVQGMMLHILRARMSEETKLFGTQDSHDE